jgi:hypothetical protein
MSNNNFKNLRQMSNKILIYTSNPDRTPRSMADVVKFAEEKSKYRLANVELSANTTLRHAKEGDRIFTKKGNTVYVLRAFENSLENLSAADRAYVEALYRKGMKNVGLTEVRSCDKYADWCSSAATVEALEKVGCKTAAGGCLTTKKDSKMVKGSLKESLLAKIKSQFLPVRIDGARLTINGEVAVINPKGDGYRVISSTGELTDYPEAMTFPGLPVFAISRPIADIVEGDIIESDGKFYKVTGKTGNKVSTICYTGSTRTKIGVKDALLNTTNYNVVVSLCGSNANGINPLMLAYIMGDGDGDFDLKDFIMVNALSGNSAIGGAGNLFSSPLAFLLLSDKKGGDIDPLMFLLMGNNGAAAGGNILSNPIVAMSLLGKGDSSDMLETMMLASALGGNAGGFNLGGLFGGAAPAAPAAKKAPARKRAAKKAPAAAPEVAAE